MFKNYHIETSHRTQSMGPCAGLLSVIREMRYHEASRQLIGILLSVAFVVIAQPVPWALYPATVLVLTGIGIRLWASGFIIKNRVLATNGPYAMVRHPLYLGNILIISAFAAASGLWWTLFIVAAFLSFYYPAAIEYEDRKLARIFQTAWSAYAETTPALLPALGRRHREIGGQWSMKTSLNGNLELFISAFLLGCFFFNFYRL